MQEVRDPDVEFFMLKTLKLLCLHCESLTNARREHRGFLVWLHEQLIVPTLWRLLRSDFIQVVSITRKYVYMYIAFVALKENYQEINYFDD